ncbi:MAG: peptidase, partial [Acidobacteria bacterium]|nr:peptidase [Acidobacteriota bacterium]
MKTSRALLASLLLLATSAAPAATITIINADPAGVGFNDPTPAAPVGGNMGMTIGEQRL